MADLEPVCKRRKIHDNETCCPDMDGAVDGLSSTISPETEDGDAPLTATTESFMDAFKKLPDHFRKYLGQNGVPDDAYNVSMLSRFVRTNPKRPNEPTEADLNSQFAGLTEPAGPTQPCSVLERVDWISSTIDAGSFFKLAASAPISRLNLYKEASIYGIDLSSAAAVAALDVQPHHNVLDLCCAPGAKLACIFDRMWNIHAKSHPSDEKKLATFTGTVTGVDVSAPRLQSCRTLCKKYRLSRVRLFLCDGSQFYTLAPNVSQNGETASEQREPSVFLTPPTVDELKDVAAPTAEDPSQQRSVAAPSEPSQLSKMAQKKLNRKLKRQPTDLPNLLFCSDYRIHSGSHKQYDRIIIDAPCTLDASIRHLLIHNKVGWLDEDGTVDVHITNLQKRLIYNGARLLAPGGVLVYSTCSFCRGQNEDVVSWLLAKMPGQFELVPLGLPEAGAAVASASDLQHCVRFYPKHSGTSGMFIAKLQKKL